MTNDERQKDEENQQKKSIKKKKAKKKKEKSAHASGEHSICLVFLSLFHCLLLLDRSR
jgi:hypothetical protein